MCLTVKNIVVKNAYFFAFAYKDSKRIQIYPSRQKNHGIHSYIKKTPYQSPT